MRYTVESLSKFPALKIVLVYAVISGVYIYTSDYIVQIFTSDVNLLSSIQTYKGLGFIFVTSLLLYVLVKRNIDITSSYYKRIIDLQESADKSLLQSKEEYMSLFNHSPIPMWLFDTETLQFLLVNDAACEAYGFSREEFLTMTLRDIRPQEDVSALAGIVSDSLNESRHTFADVFKHKRKNGEIIEVKIKVSFVVFEGRKVRVASITDVSAEMRTQSKLIEINSRLQMASEIAGLGYWTNDLIDRKIMWSEEIYKIFDVNPETFVLNLSNIKQRFHPEDQLNFDSQIFGGFESETIKEYERRIITNSGKVKWILERQYLTKDTAGMPIRIDGIVLDITNRKLHEQSIKESNERFKLLTKATVEAIIDWDIPNNEVIWGEGFQTMLGYDLREKNVYLWAKNIHVDDRRKVLYDLNKAMLDPTKQYFNAEFRFLKANGEVTFVQHKGVFLRDENGKAIRALGAMIDLTEALTAVRKIELQDRALKEIAWAQSHIVRAPLANLMGLVGLLKGKVHTGLSDEILLTHISDSAEKLDVVIREIVSKATIPENHHSTVS